jgi:hypothetical protein
LQYHGIGDWQERHFEAGFTIEILAGIRKIHTLKKDPIIEPKTNTEICKIPIFISNPYFPLHYLDIYQPSL